MEAKAGDGENDVDAGSGDEGGKKKTPNLSRMFNSRPQKLADRADDECVSSHIFIDRHVLTPILQWMGYLFGIRGTPRQEIVARSSQCDQETSVF